MRNCTVCNETMVEGFVIENGMAYFCKTDCLHQVYTPEEWIDIYAGGSSDSYWTTWEEENTDDGPGEPGECPRCFNPMEAIAELNAICLIDNETSICTDCGKEQAMNQLFKTLKEGAF